ncbi:MAG: ybeY [Caulobacteraceae bacterium]|nr:ybeY [Caulobacteraceae bacterium]
MIEVEVGADAWSTAPDAEALALRAGEQALRLAQKDGSVTVLLTNDAEVRALNARFRNKDQPTNVLSFPAPANPAGHLGDVCLAFETCQREAAEQGKTLAAHLQHLVAHGVLHLVGYDHDVDADAEIMEALERRILAALGVADPYA